MVVMLDPSVSRTGVTPAACLFARVEADSQTRAVTGYWLTLDSSTRLADNPCTVPPGWYHHWSETFRSGASRQGGLLNLDIGGASRPMTRGALANCFRSRPESKASDETHLCESRLGIDDWSLYIFRFQKASISSEYNQ
jgi:hypothetical protein